MAYMNQQVEQHRMSRGKALPTLVLKSKCRPYAPVQLGLEDTDYP